MSIKIIDEDEIRLTRAELGPVPARMAGSHALHDRTSVARNLHPSAARVPAVPLGGFVMLAMAAAYQEGRAAPVSAQTPAGEANPPTAWDLANAGKPPTTGVGTPAQPSKVVAAQLRWAQTLSWYADPANWERVFQGHPEPGGYRDSPAQIDNGERARAALAELGDQ